MNQFEFTGKIKTSLLAMIGIGVLSTLIGLFADNAGLRIWSNVLHNTVFFTGISFITLFLLCAKSLAYSGWHSQFKRLWEAFSQFLPVSIGLFLVIIAGMFAGWHHMYEWAVPEVVAEDELLQHKSGLLNVRNYIIGSVVVVGVWYFFAYLYRKYSLSEDAQGGLQWFKKTKVLSGVFLPIGGFSSAFVVWLWVMSVDPHWYSTLFAWYNAASWLVSSVALTILLLLWLKQRGYYANVTENHFHDLGKYLFGFSIFWTYLWFSQFMLIWYANVGEETVYFRMRYDEYPVLFTANFVINFLVPFFILMRNSTKRKVGTLAFVSIVLFVGHWLDFFLMLKPGIYHADQHIEHVLHAGHDDHGHDESTTHLDDHTDNTHKEEDHSSDDSHKEDDHSLADASHDDDHADGEHHDGDHAEEEHHDGDHADGDHHDDDHAKDEHHDDEHTASTDHHDDDHGDDHAAAGHGDDGGHGHEHGGVNWGFTLPGFLEFGMFIGFLGLFLFVVFTAFSKAAIIPTNDPYLEESEHHEVVFNQN